MMDIIIPFGLFMMGALVLMALQGRLPAWERRWVWLSFLAHAVSSVVLVLMTRYFFGGGDLLAYYREGLAGAELLRLDFGHYALDVLNYAMGRRTLTPLYFSGSSTGAMMGLGIWLCFFLFDSIYGACMLIALLGVASKYLIYKGLSPFFHALTHPSILWACMLLPSCVFWTSGLLKEPIAMLGMGPLVYGTSCVILGKARIKGFVLMAMGMYVISIFKAYILFPWVISGSLWFYWNRSIRRTGRVSLLRHPLYMVLLGALSFGGIILLGELFPRYSLNSLNDELVNLQTIGARTGGGSNYTLTTTPQSSAAVQLALLPLGLFMALFRPFIFEARNAALLMNALETSYFVYLWYKILRARPLRQTIKTIMASPGLIACVTFVLFFGAIVGIATTNMGTLSRYRIPMMPFYFSALLLLSTRFTASPKKS